MTRRRQNFQNISWFWDLYQRGLLDLDPPFQRRSIWSQRYREDFIDTILLDYPAPAIFLFATVSESGTTAYQLVDGKQRLTTIFDFVQDEFPVSDKSTVSSQRGIYFNKFGVDDKVKFWEYDFSVEYLPTNDETVISGIFDRLNRNVSKLTRQELRHAKYDGSFITLAEDLADWMAPRFDDNFPRIAAASRRQMKDVEFVATLLLLLEEGPRSYSQDMLDKAFNDREDVYDDTIDVENRFRDAVNYLDEVRNIQHGHLLTQSRYRNQADYYSLFGAVAALQKEGDAPTTHEANERLGQFLRRVEDESRRDDDELAQIYYEATRSASNDQGPRSKRIDILCSVLRGQV